MKRVLRLSCEYSISYIHNDLRMDYNKRKTLMISKNDLKLTIQSD